MFGKPKTDTLTLIIFDSDDYFVALNEHGGISFGIKGSHIFAIDRHHPYYERLASVRSVDTVKFIFKDSHSPQAYAFELVDKPIEGVTTTQLKRYNEDSSDIADYKPHVFTRDKAAQFLGRYAMPNEKAPLRLYYVNNTIYLVRFGGKSEQYTQLQENMKRDRAKLSEAHARDLAETLPESISGYAPSIFAIASEKDKQPATKTTYDAISELLSEAIEDTKKTYGR